MSISTRFPFFARNFRHGLAVLVLAGITLVTVGCGGGNSAPAPGGGNPNPGPTPSTAVQVKMGDAPADRVISFEVSVGPITLTPAAGGSAVTALSGTRRLELSHLSGTSEPLAYLIVPQGSYSSASITVASPEVTFINSSGVAVKLQPALNQAISVNFSPAIMIGASSSVVK